MHFLQPSCHLTKGIRELVFRGVTQQSSPLLFELLRSQGDVCQLLLQLGEQEEVGRGQIRRVEKVFNHLEPPFREIFLDWLRGVDAPLIIGIFPLLSLLQNSVDGSFLEALFHINSVDHILYFMNTFSCFREVHHEIMCAIHAVY